MLNRVKTEDRLKRLEPTGQELLDEQTAKDVEDTQRRGPFKFTVVDIPFGDEIVFVDNPTVKPVVTDDRHIEYDGETTSLSALARKLKGFDHQIQGTLWFTYEGETLNDRRLRFEVQQK